MPDQSEQACLRPGDARELGGPARSPLTTKDGLRRHYPFGMFAVPRVEMVRIQASSGTTERPTVVGYTKCDVEFWAEVCARLIRAAGARPATSCTWCTLQPVIA